MATTPLGLPYPVPTDPLTQAPDAIHALALAIEDGLITTGDLEARRGAAERVMIGLQATGQPGIMFGSSLDTYLYRSSGAQLRTNASLTLDGDVAVSSRVYFG